MPEDLIPFLFALGILILLGALFILVQMIAAVRVGERAAIARLHRWRKLPEAILRLSLAPNVEVAVQGMSAALAEGLGARGSLALVRRTDAGLQGGALKLTEAAGTLVAESDQAMVRAVLAAPFLARLAQGGPGERMQQTKVRKLPDALRSAFPKMRGGSLLALGLRLRDSHVGDPVVGLILLHMTGNSLDRFSYQTVQTVMAQFSALVETTTSRLAQAEVMEHLLEEARVKDRLIRMLLGSLQHDLGNTLASLQSGLVRIWQTQADQGAEQGAEADFVELYRTIQLVATMSRSGDSLVDMAEGKSPIVALEPHDPVELFEQLVRPFLTLRARRRPELKVKVEIAEGLPQITVDRVAFFRALSNVLHNAFKYTRRGGIRVQAYPEDSWVTFAVTDTGPGIPAESIPSLGRYQFRAETTSDAQGEGIGLWVTRRLLEEMGGGLEVESRVGKGSIFYLRFPVMDENSSKRVHWKQFAEENS